MGTTARISYCRRALERYLVNDIFRAMQEIIPVERVRYVLVHYHIFKNAGSTIEYSLEREFGAAFRAIHGPEPDSILTGVDLARFLSANPQVRAVSSHHLKFPVPEIPRTVLIDCCFLRDPLKRIWSMYNYFRRIDPTDELGERAREVDATAFVELLLRDYPHMINDVQVNLLANGGVYLRPPTQVDFERAATLLDRTSILGVVDIFDESMAAAEYYLRPVFPVQLHYVRQNSSELPLVELADGKLYREVIALNRYDLELVSRAKREVLRRFHVIPECRERLANFQERCASAAGAKHHSLSG
jgi:hypothetical protein